MPEPSPTVVRFAARAKVALFNAFAAAMLVQLALMAPVRANFTAIRLDVMNIAPDQIARFRPNLRDVPYTHDLAPGARRGYTEIRISTNAEGFRDVDHATAKPPGVFRVAVFGDSFVFGLGLSQDDTLPSALGRALGPGYETFNFGIPGMNLEGMGRMTQVFGLKYHPDLAVYSFICDDVSTTDSVSVLRWRRDYGWLRALVPDAADELFDRFFIGWKMARYTSDLRLIAMVPPLYRRRISLVLGYLHALADRNGHEVAVVDFCRNWNFAPAVRAWDAAHRRRTTLIDDFRVEVNDNDAHPTARCNRDIAARLTPAVRAMRARREAAGGAPTSRP